MADNPKKLSKNSFEGGRDTDTDNNVVPANTFRRMLNMRVFAPGTEGKAVAIMGNSLINTLLPPGTNKCIGKAKDEENNCFYYCVWNSQGYHTIYKFDEISSLTSVILQSKTDSNGVDILRWSDQKEYRINHIDVIANKLFTCVDGLNKAVKFNINKATDKTLSGYGLIIFEEFIRAYKQTAVYAPTATYVTDPARNSNNLYGNLFKFTIRFKYDDKEISNWSDWSVVAKPGNQSYTGENAITFDNNCIELTVATGNQLVEKIEIAVQANTTSDGVANSAFFICAVLDKSELSIGNNSNYVYRFYNDGSFIATNQDKINRNYSYLPRVPKAQSFVKSAMTYTNAEEGWPVVQANITVEQRLDELFLPEDTENKMSEADLLVQRQSVVRQQDSFLSGSRYNTVTKFTVGAEVKRGNVFYIFGVNGDSDSYSYSYTAKSGDTAAIVVSYLKAYLTGIGRGYPGGTSGITAEGVDGFGNVFFNYGYLGQYKQAETVWSGFVTQVSYVSLKDSGVSLQLIPYGSVTNYGVVYIDDDGRESLAYTTAVSVIRTPYITEIGSYKRPVHIISINHQPPELARYWKLVRTPQNHGLEILIQKVTPVTTDNTSEYLDLVVGSLFTYQKLHPNTILQYEFKQGDRIRIIKNVDTDTLYNGYFETEVLSYSDSVEESVNANVQINGTNSILIDGTAKVGNIGKNIIVDGFEREIIAAGGSTYTVDKPFTGGTAGTPVQFSNYGIIDRRGIIRIKVIPGITIADNSLVELFKPQSLAISTDYRVFNDFGQKFEVLNYGTATRYHAGTVQNQTVSQPAKVEISLGDAYIRDRELPINNVVPGTQVLVSRVIDPNFSDFYVSDLHDLGRVYPQDNGAGVVKFGSRTRHSANYLEDTSVNGLNDFDNLDRVDNNDSYGDILATRFLNNRLYVFKTLKDAYIPVSHTMTTDNQGVTILVQSGKLLNQIQYFTFEGGIGNNPESIFIFENWIYHSSITTLSFVRLGGEGVEPISKIFKFDKEAKETLQAVFKYNLPIIGEYQSNYGVAIWSVLSYTEYIIYGGFTSGQWKTFSDLLPNGYTYEVTQQPAAGTVTYNNTLKSFEVSGTAVGDDFFLYRPVISPGVYGAVKKQCIRTSQPANRLTSWRGWVGTEYCTLNMVTPFAFTSLTDQLLSTVLSSNVVTISGLASIGDITIDSGEYRINGGAWVSSAGTVVNGDTVQVRQTSSGSESTETIITLTVAGYDAPFSVTTGTTVVEAFEFEDLTGQPISTLTESNLITVVGATIPVTISVTGGQYSRNGSVYTSVPGTVRQGDTVRVRQTSSATATTTTDVVLTISSTSDTWSVTTGGVGDGYIDLTVEDSIIDYTLMGISGVGLPMGIDTVNMNHGETRTFGFSGTILAQELTATIYTTMPRLDVELLIHYSSNGFNQHVPINNSGVYDFPLLYDVTAPDYITIRLKII